MDEIEITYDTMDAVPEEVRGLYEERDGKAVLTKVRGLKTQGDVDYVLDALRKEKEDHRKVRDGLKAWGDMKPDEVLSRLERIPELEAAAEGKIDDEKLNKMVESRLAQHKGPLERQIKSWEEKFAEADGERTQLKAQIERRDLHEAVRGVATEMKVHPTAIPDVEMVAERYLERDQSGNFIVRDGVNGVTPGLDVKGFLKEMQKARPHWWPESSGGGGRGSGFGGWSGPNPWAGDQWNVTAQHQVVRTEGREVADRMAKAAGTTVGGIRPQKT